MTPDTLFQIGSITKTFTATALMRLAERGELDLDTPLVRYLPEFSLSDPDWTARVTPRHLLTHTGGWDGDYFMVHPIGGRGDDALQRIVAAMRDVPLQTEPGTLYHYNNIGVSVAGRLLEVLTGRVYEQAVQNLVLNPLGMDNSYLLPEDFLHKRFAVPHAHGAAESVSVVRWWQERQWSASGAIVSSVRDMLTYARFHLSQGASEGKGEVLSSGALERMQTQQVENGDMSDAVGLSLTRQISAWIVERITGLDAQVPAPITLPAGKIEEYVGRYDGSWMSVRVSKGPQGLQAGLQIA